jgi:glyoxylate carboligase
MLHRRALPVTKISASYCHTYFLPSPYQKKIRLSKSGFFTIIPVLVDKYLKDSQHAQLLFDHRTAGHT